MSATRRLSLQPTCRTPCSGLHVIFLAVGTPTTPTGAADLSAVFSVAKAIGQRAQRVQGRRNQIDSTGGNNAQDSRPHSKGNGAAVRCRFQPGVSQAGRGGRRLHEAGSDHRGRRRSEACGNPSRSLCAVRPHRKSGAGREHPNCRNAEICRQCVSRGTDLVHERDCKSLRNGRRRCRHGSKRA